MDNYGTLSVQAKLNQHANSKALAAIQQTGRALPCSVVSVNGSLVTVKFEVNSAPWTLPFLTLPKAENQYLRAPTQPGDYGITVPGDTDLSQISGQGGGVPDLQTNFGNLSTLVFVPVASTTFNAPPRANIVWANGPHGARIGDSGNTAYLDCNPDMGTVTIHAGGRSWTFSAVGLTMATGVVAELHMHGGVRGGPDETGPPIP